MVGIVDTATDIDNLITMGSSPAYRQHRLYEALREKFKKPTTLLAAESLRESVQPDDVVIVTTGFVHQLYPYGEDDGPLGAASLARAVCYGLGGKTLTLSEPSVVGVLKATCHAAGVRALDATTFKQLSRSSTQLEFPVLPEEESKNLAATILDEWQPSAIIAVEKCGPNAKGVYHTAGGIDMTATTSKVDLLIDEARTRGIPTIGIADGGNEIGMGVILDTVKRVHPTGAKCQCPKDSPCGGTGGATVVETDIALVGNSSNFGAYGITACLATLLKNPDILQDSITEAYMVKECVSAGSHDGSGAPGISVIHGIPWHYHMKFVEMLRYIVDVGIQEPPKEAMRYV